MNVFLKSLAGVLLVVNLVGPASAAEHRLGIGVQYWQTADDIFEAFDLDESGAALVASYEIVPQELFRGIFRFNVDLELYADGYGGSDETAYAPVVYIVSAEYSWYVAFGVGAVVSDGLRDSVSDPFYTARFGWLFDFEKLVVDVNFNYRTDAFGELGDSALDVMSLGVYGRYKL